MLDMLRASSSPKTSDEGDQKEFDLLIVGGGATGAGVAVDAATRGLKVALVERDDFSAGEFPPNVAKYHADGSQVHLQNPPSLSMVV